LIMIFNFNKNDDFLLFMHFKRKSISSKFTMFRLLRIFKILRVFLYFKNQLITASSWSTAVDSSLRWWYGSNQYTVWYSLLIEWCTRFSFYLLSALYVRCVGHMTHANLMRSDYLSIYLIRLIKSFDHTLQSLWKWWNRFYFWSSILSIHSLTLTLMTFVSINLLNVWHELLFVMTSTKLDSFSIHRIFVIFLRSYDWRKHIKSIINRFSDVISSLTRQS
jgi:hypothetical protein